MNPMLAKKLEELQALTEDIRSACHLASETIEKHRQEKEETQQEQWRLQKDLAALKRLAEDYETLAEAHERHRRQRTQLREGLQRILTHAKALGLEYQE